MAVTVTTEPKAKATKAASAGGKGKATATGEAGKAPATDALLATTGAFQCKPLKEIKLYKDNARMHSPEQIKELAHFMVEVGYTQPVLLDDKGLIAGHGRIAAVKLCYEQGHELKFAGSGVPIPKGTIPFIDISGLPKVKREALIIWDNKSAEKSDWDIGKLAIKLEELNALDVLPLTGFDTSELDTLLVEMKDTTFTPEVNPQTVSKPVTAEDMKKGHIKMGEKYDDASSQDLVNVMCPHCAKEFQIDKPK